MNQRTLIVLALVCVGSLFIQAMAGIPEPDVILYGSLCVNGVRQRAAQTDVVVEAAVEVEGSPRVVGRYRMGDSERAGDSYVLRIQRESGVDGSEQSSDTARVGGRIHVTLQKGNALPTEAALFTIDDPGTVRKLDLFLGDVGLDGDGDGDLRDFALFQRCFTGSGPDALSPGCSAADKDHDGDVDLIDYQSVFGALAGPCG